MENFSATGKNNGAPNISGAYDKGAWFYTHGTDGQTCWYPAHGRFQGMDATREQVGLIGYYWSANDIAATVSSYHLYFTNTTVYPYNDDYHSHTFGLSVRCIRE